MKAYTKHRIIEGDGTRAKMDIDVDQGTQSLKLSIKTMPFIIAFENIDQFCQELKNLAAENKKSIALDRSESDFEDLDDLSEGVQDGPEGLLRLDQTVDRADTHKIAAECEIKPVE